MRGIRIWGAAFPSERKPLSGNDTVIGAPVDAKIIPQPVKPVIGARLLWAELDKSQAHRLRLI